MTYSGKVFIILRMQGHFPLPLESAESQAKPRALQLLSGTAPFQVRPNTLKMAMGN